MSRNIGKKRTLTADGHGYGKAFSMSIGLPIRKTCPVCRKPKKAGSSHPKCSPILQQMSRGLL